MPLTSCLVRLKRRKGFIMIGHWVLTFPRRRVDARVSVGRPRVSRLDNRTAGMAVAVIGCIDVIDGRLADDRFGLLIGESINKNFEYNLFGSEFKKQQWNPS